MHGKIMYAIFIYQEEIYDTHIIQTPSATGIARCAARQPSSMKTSSASLSGPTNRACRAHKLITSGPAIGTQRLTTFCGAHKPSHYLSRRRQQSAQKHQQTSNNCYHASQLNAVKIMMPSATGVMVT